MLKGKKVAVGVSGGVDSSVAAYLLKKARYEITGVFMKCWETGEVGCASDEDKVYAVQSAAKMDIPFEQIDFVSEYKSKVLDYFYSEYKNGRTPNPDVMCNKEIKFGLFFNWAISRGFDYVATGHYARVKKVEGAYKLLRGTDDSKDQSYFLYLLTQEHLSKVLFPVGDLKKSDVRKIAEEVGLPNAKRADSTGICFVGEVDVKEFLMKGIKPKKGDVVNTRGEVIGYHDGVWFYTIGKRHGFTVTKYVGEPLYVVGKNIELNTLIVGTREEASRKDFVVSDLHWVGNLPQTKNLGVRIRHLGEIYKCKVSGERDGVLRVELSQPVFGVAPGQSAVFYFEEEVLGGGVISI